MSLYDGIDEVSQNKCVEAFNVLADEFNNGDMLIKNFVANNLFNFLLSIITNENVKNKLSEVYNMLE